MSNRLASPIEAAHVEWAHKQPSVARCLWCRWSRKGTVGETMAAFELHRADKHPDKVPHKTERNRRIKTAMEAQGRRAMTAEEIIAAIQRFTEENGNPPSTRSFEASRKEYMPTFTNVKNVFGTVDKARAAAGFPGVTRGRRKSACLS